MDAFPEVLSRRGLEKKDYDTERGGKHERERKGRR